MNTKYQISPATSAFLDALRIAAALFVFANHCAQFWSPEIFALTAPVSHSAVVIFFVLSGYVITHSTMAKRRDVKRFAVARLSRLYSVVIPALLLTLLLQCVGTAINPKFYAELSRSSDIIRYMLTFCFLQNIWTNSACPPTNGPFWSLSYEFWYYVLFAVSVFISARRLKYSILLAIAAFVGPNILLLMPCWLVGAALVVYRNLLLPFYRKPKTAFVVSLPVMLATCAFLPEFPYHLGHKYFWFSSAFLTDWLTALVVGSTIISFEALPLTLIHKPWESLIRWCADHTFSLYLYHFPLIVFATAVIPFNKAQLWKLSAIAAGVIIIVLFLSCVTEAKRDKLKKAFALCFDSLFRNRASIHR